MTIIKRMKNHIWKNAVVLVLCTAMIAGSAIPAAAAENSSGVTGTVEEVTVDEGEKPYISLGADLKPDERATVLDLLGVKESDLENYDVTTVTNEQEHQYLDSYISSDKIGSRALSSVVVLEGEKGSGIHVTTKHITYCTEGMYENALATAGIEDAEVIVAGPFDISGTAALIGAIEAYSTMTGKDIEEQVIDGAIDEIVTTGAIEESTGETDQVEGMIAYLKEQLAQSSNKSDAELEQDINDAAEQFDVTLSPEEVEQLKALLKKLQKMDLDWDNLAKQAQSVFDQLKSRGFSLDNLNLDNLNLDDIDTEEIANQAGGFFSRLISFIQNLFQR